MCTLLFKDCPLTQNVHQQHDDIIQLRPVMTSYPRVVGLILINVKSECLASIMGCEMNVCV